MCRESMHYYESFASIGYRYYISQCKWNKHTWKSKISKYSNLEKYENSIFFSSSFSSVYLLLDLTILKSVPKTLVLLWQRHVTDIHVFTILKSDSISLTHPSLMTSHGLPNDWIKLNGVEPRAVTVERKQTLCPGK